MSAPRIALVDLGLQPDHPALAGADIAHHRFGGRGDPRHHGTRSAALLLGAAGFVTGPRPRLFVATVGPGAADRTLAQALEWAGAQGADCVALPLGQARLGPRSRAAIARLVSLEAPVFAAAGNAGARHFLEPAVLPGVLSVTATRPDGQILSYCCASPSVALRAPGYRLATGVGTPDHCSGSSVATALVARWRALGKTGVPRWSDQPSPEGP